MLKNLAKTAGGILVMLILGFAMSCDNEALPTGDLVSQGGAPGGSTLGGGGAKSTFPVFDINNMPTPKFWNDNGHYENLPDLFTFANGKKVQTADDWLGPQGRRWEIEQIVQYYMYGYMPPYGDDVVVDWDQISDTSLRVNITYNGRTVNFTVSAHIPDGIQPNAGIPGFMYCGSNADSTTWPNARQGRYAALGFPINTLAPDSQQGGGIVADLFGYRYDGSDLNVASAFMAHAWGAGRFIDALETPHSDGKLPFDGKIDPTKLLITGVSRNGKAAEMSAIFAKSKKGTQIAVLDIGSAGYLGPAIERFLSPLGIHEDYSLTVAEALPQDNHPGRVYYMQFIGGNEGNSLVPGIGSSTSWFTDHETAVNQPPYGPNYGPVGTDLATASGGYPLVVKTITPAAYQTAKSSSDAAVRNSVFKYDLWPYEGISGANYWHGVETLAQLQKGAPYWMGQRFPMFEDKHYGLRLDDVLGIPLRRPDGFLCTIPFDMHFPLALMAPRAIIIHDGFRTIRCNPEGCFMAFLAVDEVYKFLEEQGVRPQFADVSGFDQSATLSDFNTIKFYHITHSYPEYETRDTIDLADVYFGYKNKTATNIARLRDRPFPVDDPRSKRDYQRLNWARPGAVPLSEQIKDVPDYDWAGHKLTKWD